MASSFGVYAMFGKLTLETAVLQASLGRSIMAGFSTLGFPFHEFRPGSVVLGSG